MIFSSSFARRRILSLAIAGLIFFHFFANGDHKQTVYKSKNLKQFRIAIQKARMKKSAGKILMKSTKVPRPPSLPLQIFWEYGKSKGQKAKCLEEKKLITYMLKKPNLCHQEKFSRSSPTSPAQCLSSIACNSTKASEKEEGGVYCASSTEILCCLDPESCQKDDTISTPPISSAARCLAQPTHAKFGLDIKQNLPCKFPFVYMGVKYNECTSFSDKNCDRWCSLATGPDDSYLKGSGLWGYCLPSCPYRTATEETETNRRSRYKAEDGTTLRCYTGDERKYKSMWPRFKVEREKHNNTWVEEGSCPTVLSSDSISNSYRISTSFSYTPPSLSSSHNCSFPFYYKDKKYTTCTSVDDPDCRFWCSTENDGGFHRSATSLWAHCGTLCPPEESVSEDRCKKGSSAHFYQAEFTGFAFLESEDPDFDFYTMDKE